MPRQKSPSSATYTVSLAHRKARGSGHERREEILAAAKSLFALKGAENVTTREIAAQVGISQAALFTYYKNKDEMLTGVMEKAFGELAATLVAIDREAADGRDWFRRIVAGYVDFGLAYPDEYRLAFMVVKAHQQPLSETGKPGVVAAATLPVFEQFAQRIGRAMAEGLLRTDLGPPAQLAQILWAGIHGLTSLLIARPRPHFPWADKEVLVRDLTEMLLNGLVKSP
jgi:AcrR family transcriptional regulator